MVYKLNSNFTDVETTNYKEHKQAKKSN